jgi:succinate dehydrogenase / fumarate reductase cytochrome b subunit
LPTGKAEEWIVENVPSRHVRPLSPNIQIYQPQLTSVLSIANRIAGVLLSACAVVLVGWLIAAASGPEVYLRFHDLIASWPGQILLLIGTFAFFLHLCGGIRHLVWDTVRGFELRQIYASGWMVVAASVVLTLVCWFASLLIVGQG